MWHKKKPLHDIITAMEVGFISREGVAVSWGIAGIFASY